MRRIWGIYREVFRPTEIEGIGIRYVNQLEIPEGSEIKEYLNLYPELASPMPQQLDGFMIRVQIPQPEISAISLLTEATTQPTREKFVGVLLDMDLVSVGHVPHDDDSLWNLLEIFHAKQFETFKNCITPLTEKLIE